MNEDGLFEEIPVAMKIDNYDAEIKTTLTPVSLVGVLSPPTPFLSDKSQAGMYQSFIIQTDFLNPNSTVRLVDAVGKACWDYMLSRFWFLFLLNDDSALNFCYGVTRPYNQSRKQVSTQLSVYLVHSSTS